MAKSSTGEWLRIPTPPKIRRAMGKPSRYKALYGGRGSGKSHFFCNLILARCLEKTTRVVCIREVQNSIRDSVRQLLVDKIHEFGLEYAFEVLSTEIRSKVNNSLIIFRGMNTTTSANIKSLEGYDVAFVEEAQTLSATSWGLLRPTIRKPGSEIFCAWNPRHSTDPIDKFFRGVGCPEDAIVVEVNWNDNGMFPEVLRREMLEDYKHRPDEAANVWGGDYVKITEGAIYAQQIADLERDGMLWTGQFNPALPVHTSFDLGVRDKAACWFWQQTMRHVTVVDYFETEGEGLEQIVQQALPELLPDMADAARQCVELGRSVPFDYGRHYMPHDILVREFGSGGRSRYEIAQSYGLRNIHTGIAANPRTRIAAVRSLLPLAKFVPKASVEFGVKRLRDYRRRYNESLQTYTEILHDDASHGSDAFGEFAVNCPLVRLPTIPEEVFDEPDIQGQVGGKMKIKFDTHAYLQRKEREHRAENE